MRFVRLCARLIVVLVVFATAAYPCRRLELLCQREVYHALESTGIITRGPNLWGQIMGRNIPRHPAWMTVGVRSIGTLGILPAMMVALMLTPQLGTAWRAVPTPERWKWAVRPVIVAWIVYAIATAVLEPHVSNSIASGAFSLGKLLGCGYFQSGAIAIGPDGPFMTGRWAPACNAIWRIAPSIVGSATAFVPAMLVFHVLVRRRVASLGPGCTTCGYDVTGLRGPLCPECGAAITSHKLNEPLCRDSDGRM